MGNDRPSHETLEQRTKDAIKEAIKEWLDEKFADFGRWSFYGLSATFLAGVIYFILITSGWKHTP